MRCRVAVPLAPGESALPPPPADCELCVVARRNNALATRQRWLLFGILAGSSLGVGIALSAFGAWPVLPWSCVEIGALAAAFALMERRARDWERLLVVGDRVIVERERRGKAERREWNRPWVQVELDSTDLPGGLGGPRLSLRFAGESVDFGGELPPRERARVAQELKRLLAQR